jgi:hypothetical protein
VIIQQLQVSSGTATVFLLDKLQSEKASPLYGLSQEDITLLIALAGNEITWARVPRCSFGTLAPLFQALKRQLDGDSGRNAWAACSLYNKVCLSLQLAPMSLPS